LKNENAELKQKVEELNDKYLRLFAEFDNYKKRSHKERLEQSKSAGIEVIISLLPVLDDFSRATRQMEGNSDASTQGIRLIYQKLASILEAKGLKQMKSIGEVFNPELHDAISEISIPGEESKGKVVDEIESGYYLNDKIIRHAKVVVGK
jgi:molecular chaperone GrpE